MNIVMISLLNWLLIAACIAAMVCLVASTAYDIIHTPLQRRLDKGLRSRMRKRPHVTLLVLMENGSDGLEQCLSSIRSNRYRNHDIVIVDNGRTSQARAQTRMIVRQQPNTCLYYYATRRRMTDIRALREGYKRSQRGEIILVLTSSQRCLPSTLKRIVLVFANEQAVGILQLPLVYKGAVTIQSVTSHLGQATQYVLHKVRALVMRRDTIRGLAPQAFLKDAFMTDAKSRRLYMADIPLEERQLRTKDRVRGVGGSLRAIVQIGFVGVLGVSIGLAMTSDIDQPFLLSWGLVSAWTFIVILLYDHVSLSVKGSLLMGTFISIFVYSAMIFINVTRLISDSFKPVIRLFPRN